VGENKQTNKNNALTSNTDALVTIDIILFTAANEALGAETGLWLGALYISTFCLSSRPLKIDLGHLTN